MEEMDARLAEEVRHHEHLYNPSLRDYKDAHQTAGSWRQIAGSLGMEVPECAKRWRKLRDRFVRLKKSVRSRGNHSGCRRVLSGYASLAWLEPHIKHRRTEEQDKEEQQPAPCEPAEASTSSSPEPETIEEAFAPAKDAAPAAPQTSTPRRRRRRRPTTTTTPDRELDDSLAQQVALIDQRRAELYERLDHDAADEYTRFGRTVADLLKRVPEHQRVEAMRNIMSCIFEHIQ